MALTQCPECAREVSDQAGSCPHCGKPLAHTAVPLAAASAIPPPPPPKKKRGCLVGGCLALLILFVVLLVIGGNSKRAGGGSTASTTTEAPPPPPPKTPLENTQLVDFSWKKGGFNAVMLADFTIKNNNDLAVKDIRVECTHYANSGTRIDSNHQTIYDIVQPHKKRTFREVNMGFIHTQASSSDCKIVGVSLGGK